MSRKSAFMGALLGSILWALIVLLAFAGPAWAAVAIDGTPVTATGTTTTSQVLPAFTTTGTNRVVIIVALVNGPNVNSGAVTSISDTAGLSWSKRAQIGGSGFDIEEWYAVAPVALTGDVATVNLTASPSFNAMTEFAASGTNTSAPWDTNVVLPVRSQANAAVTVSTTAAATMILGLYRQGNTNSTAGTGFTLITGVNFLLTERDIVATAQTNLSVAVGSVGTINGAIGDALAAGTTPTTKGSAMLLMP